MFLSIGRTGAFLVEASAVASMAIFGVLAAWSHTPGVPRYALFLFYSFGAIMIAGCISVVIATNGGGLVAH